ncbi:16486_t:CDS:2, partial [Funneliformis mosseae]
TLDGCVKVYTSRVDSVATETGKLLSGLLNSSKNNDENDRDDDVDLERRTRKKEDYNQPKIDITKHRCGNVSLRTLTNIQQGDLSFIEGFNFSGDNNLGFDYNDDDDGIDREDVEFNRNDDDEGVDRNDHDEG